MIYTTADFCRNCNHSVHTHIGPFGRDGEEFGYFKIKVWDKCNYRSDAYDKLCGCVEFLPEDNLKYLEMLSEQSAN